MDYNEYRRRTTPIFVGGVGIGGNHPIAVQSMTNTPTHDLEATYRQALRLEEAGCDILRITAPDLESVKTFRELKRRGIKMPLVADIHFSAAIAVAAAEAGVLGTPFVRFNDFVGRIGYLRELEDVYQLGYGIHATPLTEESTIRRNDGSLQPSGVEALYNAVETLVAMPAEERRALYAERRERMLSEKIDYAKFLTWFIENYPESQQQTRENQNNDAFWVQFK